MIRGSAGTWPSGKRLQLAGLIIMVLILVNLLATLLMLMDKLMALFRMLINMRLRNKLDQWLMLPVLRNMKLMHGGVLRNRSGG